MKNAKKRVAAMFLAFLLVFCGSVITMDVVQTVPVFAASAVKLNKTKLTLKKGQTYQLKLSPDQKKVKWSSSKKTVVSVSKKGKLTAKKLETRRLQRRLGRKNTPAKLQ